MLNPEQIIYEDNHLMVINKYGGQIAQSDKTGDICMSDEIRDFLRVRDSKPGNIFCGVVHRIDRPVSGAVVFAKTSKALSRLNQMVKDRNNFSKTYWAIVKNAPPKTEDRLEHHLKRVERLNKSFVVDKPTADSKLAVLDYRVIAVSAGGYYLLEVTLHTGRHHQIRCQLAHIGCPIKGDLKYGYPRSNKDGNISLHARRLELDHPVRHDWMTFVAAPPADFVQLFSDKVDVRGSVVCTPREENAQTKN